MKSLAFLKTQQCGWTNAGGVLLLADNNICTGGAADTIPAFVMCGRAKGDARNLLSLTVEVGRESRYCYKEIKVKRNHVTALLKFDKVVPFWD